MKRIVVTLIASLMTIIFMTLNVFAMPFNPNEYTSVNEVSDLMERGVKQSKVTESSKTRGDFFASADLVIKDNGNGDIGALAIAFTRYPVDEAYITVYLDRWDATNERWRQVNSYEAEFYAADYPDGLSEPTVDITFTNNTKGYYYRIRGVFAVVYNNEFEGFSPVTNGILIE